MDENLYNYDNMYGGGLASQAYAPYSPTYRPTLTSVKPPALDTSLPAVPGASNPSGATTPGRSWMANAQALGTLGLGLASFLDQRKTADLQRQAMRQNLDVAREHQASRKALGASWNKAWGQ
jgi:hypothetical protein